MQKQQIVVTSRIKLTSLRKGAQVSLKIFYLLDDSQSEEIAEWFDG